jgi:hypothetical protein
MNRPPPPSARTAPLGLLSCVSLALWLAASIAGSGSVRKR